jgi:hypothetical protein
VIEYKNHVISADEMDGELRRLVRLDEWEIHSLVPYQWEQQHTDYGFTVTHFLVVLKREVRVESKGTGYCPF